MVVLVERQRSERGVPVIVVPYKLGWESTGCVQRVQYVAHCVLYCNVWLGVAVVRR
jgi:hypothetical protein